MFWKFGYIEIEHRAAQSHLTEKLYFEMQTTLLHHQILLERLCLSFPLN